MSEEIYPRGGVYPKRVTMFAENIRDGFKFDPIEVQIHPEYGDKYRILDGRIKMLEDRRDELNNRLEQRKANLLKEQQYTVSNIQHIGSAWVLL